MSSVYVTRRLASAVIESLEEAFDLVLNDEEWPPPRDETLARAAGKDGLLTMTNDTVDDELLGMLCVGAPRAVLLEARCPANALNPQVLAART